MRTPPEDSPRGLLQRTPPEDSPRRLPEDSPRDPTELSLPKAVHGIPARIGPKRGEFCGHCHISRMNHEIIPIIDCFAF